MIGDNGNGTTKRRPIRVAVEDAITIFIFSFFTALIAAGSTFPPPVQVLYASALTSVLAGTISWAKARNVSVAGG